MQIKFTDKEREWLFAVVQRLLTLANSQRESDAGKFLRIANKMRAKFAPNALITYLTQAERSLVYTMAEHRAIQLAKTGGLSDESELLYSIMEKTGFGVTPDPVTPEAA